MSNSILGGAYIPTPGSAINPWPSITTTPWPTTTTPTFTPPHWLVNDPLLYGRYLQAMGTTMASGETDGDIYRMIAVRMRWKEHELHPGFRKLVPTKLDDDKYCIFIVTSTGKATIVEDDAALFPSDALITQLRLLQEKSK